MKKQSLLLITGGLLALASCNTESANNADNSQAKIDSMVNARVEELRMELEAKNDSMINAMAMLKADSMMAEMAKTGKKPAAKPKTTAPVGISKSGSTEATTTAPASTDPLKSKSDANKKSGSESLKSKSDDNQQSGSKKLKDRADK